MVAGSSRRPAAALNPDGPGVWMRMTASRLGLRSEACDLELDAPARRSEALSSGACSARQHQGFGFRVGLPEEAILGGAAAGEQKQGHVDAKGCFKPPHHVHGLTETAGVDG